MALCVVAVGALAAAGIWSIAVARRGAVDHAASVFSLETTGRARAIESALSSTRAELAFLTGSATLTGLDVALESKDPMEARWRRIGAEAAMLLLLRSRPEIQHLIVTASGTSQVLVAAGRRGGVPVVWHPAGAAAMLRPASGGINTIVDLAPTEAGTGVQLAAGLDAAALLAHHGSEANVTCALRGADGGPLTRDIEPQPGEAEGSAVMRAEASINAEGWSAASPWTLACARGEDAAIALIEPLVSRYRLTIALNALVLTLAILLGSFAIQQMRRRERLEGKAREESRVREVERQLFHAERLTTVGRLAAGMAHEINNPLEGMSNYMVLASDALMRDDVAAATRHLEKARSGLDAVAGVVRQILMHADPAVAPRAAIGLSETVMQAVELVRSRAEFERIRFQCDVPAAGPAVMGNQVLLGQVFMNLALNACEAQPHGGEVKVVVFAEEGGWAVVEFADRGPGIAPGDAERIFEPFYSTKGSTGLGLSICHAIARQHGGSLSASDRPGGGASFVLRLPGLGASGTQQSGGTTHAGVAR